MCINNSFATFRCRKCACSSRMAVRIMADSLAITDRSSAAVLQARTLRIKSRSFMDMMMKDDDNDVDVGEMDGWKEGNERSREEERDDNGLAWGGSLVDAEMTLANTVNTVEVDRWTRLQIR